MADQSELLQIAHAFQRVLSGHPRPHDVEFCRALEPLNSILQTVLIPGESEDDAVERLVVQLQNTTTLRDLAQAGGEHFDTLGRCRSPEQARAFMDAAFSALKPSRLAPKEMICGLASLTEDQWNDTTFRHNPNFGVWTLQLVYKGVLELSWDGSTKLCESGDMIIVPPQASTSHRRARDSAHYEEYWFHFTGTSRLLQWLDWIPRLSQPAILRYRGEDEDLFDLAARVIELNGFADDLQHHLQQVMFEQLLIRQRMRVGPLDTGRSSDHADVAKQFIMEHLFEPLSLEGIATHCGISSAHLSDVFKAETGVTPMRWRERERLNQAGELLKNSRLTVTEVASLAGYGDYRHFAKRFKVVTGLTPSTYRRT